MVEYDETESMNKSHMILSGKKNRYESVRQDDTDIEPLSDVQLKIRNHIPLGLRNDNFATYVSQMKLYANFYKSIK